MMQMNYDQIKSICGINRYSYKLCHDNKYFWMKKFKYEQLLLPDKLEDIN